MNIFQILLFLVPMVGLYNPRRENSPLDYFLILLFESHLKIVIKNSIWIFFKYYYFLVPMVGLYNPRRENSPLDYFLILLFESHLKFVIKNSIWTFLKYYYFWYRWWDSNPHGFPPDFESGASANSATSAYCFFVF